MMGMAGFKEKHGTYMLWFRQVRPFSVQTVRKRAGGLEKELYHGSGWVAMKVCNKRKNEQRGKVYGETKVHTF